MEDTMHKTRGLSALAVVATAAMTLAACSGSGATTSTSGASTVTYGVLSCFTGRLASLGQAMLQGTQAAEKAINSAGGVLGKRTDMAQGDTSCDLADAVPATKQLLSHNVAGVIGPTTQEIAAVEPILRGNKIVDEFQGGDPSFDHHTDPFLFRDSP
ncbi:MAG: ABC transporter substrate-binding protein, partial [Sciscionella sp.]